MGRTVGTLIGSFVLAAMLVVPATASTVRAERVNPGTYVRFQDTAGQVNNVAVGVPRRAREIRFRDDAGPIEPEGNRCEEIPGAAFRVDCRLGGRAFFDLIVDAGGGDDAIVSDLRERYDGRTASFVHLFGGSGADRINAGAAEDSIVPGTGPDVVHAGSGYDFIAAGDSADGPDLYDGGRKGATVSYSERTTPTFVDSDGVADDGATGEGDNLRRVFGASGGSARDVFIGDDHRNFLFGGGGPDRLLGRGDRDAIVGDSGADRIDAGPGADWVLDGGSAGIDVIDCGPGRDLYEADPDDVVVSCERSLVNPQPKLKLRSRLRASAP